MKDPGERGEKTSPMGMWMRTGIAGVKKAKPKWGGDENRRKFHDVKNHFEKSETSQRACGGVQASRLERVSK